MRSLAAQRFQARKWWAAGLIARMFRDFRRKQQDEQQECLGKIVRVRRKKEKIELGVGKSLPEAVPSCDASTSTLG